MQNGTSQLVAREAAVLLVVDPEEPLLGAVRTVTPALLKTNILNLVQAARALEIPIVVTTASDDLSGGAIWAELQEFDGQAPILRRPTFNPFQSAELAAELSAIGRATLVIAGLWTEGCVSHAALTGLAAGYDVQIAVDCLGSASDEAHHFGVQRLIQAGCVPVSWRQLFFEWQQAWNDPKPSQTVIDLIRNHPETDDAYRQYLDALQT